VTECNRHVPGFPVFVLEPGSIRPGLASWWSTGAGQDFSIGIAKAEPGQDIADQEPALPSGPIILPLAQPAFSHLAEKLPAFA